MPADALGVSRLLRGIERNGHHPVDGLESLLGRHVDPAAGARPRSTRGRAGAWRWQLSAYDIEIEEEILNVNVQPFPGASFTVPTYRNADRTRHWGIEAGIDATARVRALAGRDGGETIGMRLAFTYSVEQGLCPPEDAARIERHLKAVGLPANIADIPGKRLVCYRVPVQENGLRVWREMKEVDTSDQGAHPHWPPRFFARLVDTYLAQTNNRGGQVGEAQSFIFSAHGLLGFSLGVMTAIAADPQLATTLLTH